MISSFNRLPIDKRDGMVSLLSQTITNARNYLKEIDREHPIFHRKNENLIAQAA